MDTRIRRLYALFLAGFTAVFMWLPYWQVFRARELGGHVQNPRLLARGLVFSRGSIYAGDGSLVAYSRQEAGLSRRVFEAHPSLVHTVGYENPRYGRSGLESAMDPVLSGVGDEGYLDTKAARFLGIEKRGDDVATTLHPKIQEAAARALEGVRGAVVAVDPATGAILAMVSSPWFDPGRLTESWESLAEDPATPLLNRATQGLYPPGSAFKILVLAAALESEVVEPGETFHDQGTITIDGYTMENLDRRAYGKIDVTQALVVSSNVVFASLGLRLGGSRLLNFMRAFGLGDNPGLEIGGSRARVPSSQVTDRRTLAQLSIGQSGLTVTPLQMALVAATIANGGRTMRPHLVEEVRDPRGRRVRVVLPEELRRPVSPETARLVAQAMVRVVEEGTGKSARLEGVQVAGKTGTAENPHGRPHAWFVGFAPAGAPQVAVSVLVENGGYGGRAAAPIARKVIQAALGASFEPPAPSSAGR